MKKLMACVLTTLALGASGSGWAQATPDSEKAAKELVTTIKYREKVAVSMKQNVKGLPMYLMQTTAAELGKNTTMSNDQKKAAMQKAEQALPKATAALEAILFDNKTTDEMEKSMIASYAKAFKADELKQMTAFLQTPVGAKFFSTYPQVMGEAEATSQKSVMQRMAPLVEKFVKDHAK